MIIDLNVLSFDALLSDVVVAVATRLTDGEFEAAGVPDLTMLFDDGATDIFGFRWVFSALSNRVRLCWLVAES